MTTIIPDFTKVSGIAGNCDDAQANPDKQKYLDLLLRDLDAAK